MKTCPRCRETKPRSDFYGNKRRADGLQVWCKACFSEHKRDIYPEQRETILARQKKRREENPERVAELAKAWRDRNVELVKKIHRASYQKNKPKRQASIRRYALREFGLTEEEYDVLFDSQGGRCAICRETSQQHLCVDHCHDTGIIRGLLCRKCNAGVGLLGDTTEHLEKALAYLRAAYLKAEAK